MTTKKEKIINLLADFPLLTGVDKTRFLFIYNRVFKQNPDINLRYLKIVGKQLGYQCIEKEAGLQMAKIDQCGICLMKEV